MARWDWYRGTLHGAGADEVAAALCQSFDLVDLVPATPKNGYIRGAEVRRGSVVCAWLWWDGNPGVCVTGSGEHAPTVAAVCRHWEHRVTRADACEDWEQAGLFDRLAEVLCDYAKRTRVAINQQGDWVNGKGRTLYLGSRQSSAQLVLYEKGAQMGLDRPWVRLEARVYPKGAAGYRVASWHPGEAFGAAPWMVDALRHIGWDHLQAQSVGTVWRPPDLERAKVQLVRQYRATLSAWRDEVGGSWERFGEAFEALAEELDRGTVLH